MYHYGATFLGIITCGFSGRVNVPLPCLCVFFQPITFGIVAPNKSFEVARACAHLKTVTQAKPFSVFKISGCTIKTLLYGLGYYPCPEPNSLSELKYNSSFAKLT